MGRIIYNIPAASHNAAPLSLNQAEPDSLDFEALKAAFAGTGVLAGCGTHQSVTPDTFVVVEAGTVKIGGSSVAVAGGSIALLGVGDEADPTNPRWDIVYVTAAGALAKVKGTPAPEQPASGQASPALPDLDVTANALLAVVYIPAAATTILDNQIQPRSFRPALLDLLASSLYDITAYGAVGDGTTDDTAAIQVAIDAANAAGGGTVYVPAPSVAYLTTAQLTLYGNISLRGEGAKSILRLQVGTAGAADGTNLLKTAALAERWIVDNIHLQVEIVTGGTFGGAAFLVESSHQCFAQNLWIDGKVNNDVATTDRWEYGIYVHDPTANELTKDVFFSQFSISNIRNGADSSGIRVRGRAGSRHLFFAQGVVQSRTIDGTDYTTSGTHGLWLESFDGFHIEQCEIIKWKIPGRLDATNGLTFITNARFGAAYFEVSDENNPALLIGGGVISGVSFVNCNMFGTGLAGRRGIDIDAPGATHVTRVVFVACEVFGGVDAIRLQNTGGGTVDATFSDCPLRDGSTLIRIDHAVTQLIVQGCRLASAQATPTGIRLPNVIDPGDIIIVANRFAPSLTTPINIPADNAFPTVVVEGNTPRSVNWDHEGNAVVLQDEFFMAMFSVTLGLASTLNWFVHGDGTVQANPEIASANVLGVIRFQTTATAGGLARLAMPREESGFTALRGWRKDERWQVMWRVKRVSPSDNRVVRIGVMKAGGSDPPDGMYFEYDTALGDTTWWAVTQSGTRTRTNTTIAWESTSYRTMRIINLGATIRFQIDTWGYIDHTADVLVGTDVLGALCQLKAINAAAKPLDIDTFAMRIVGLAR